MLIILMKANKNKKIIKTCFLLKEIMVAVELIIIIYLIIWMLRNIINNLKKVRIMKKTLKIKSLSFSIAKDMFIVKKVVIFLEKNIKLDNSQSG